MCAILNSLGTGVEYNTYCKLVIAVASLRVAMALALARPAEPPRRRGSAANVSMA